MRCSSHRRLLSVTCLAFVIDSADMDGTATNKWNVLMRVYLPLQSIPSYHIIQCKFVTAHSQTMYREFDATCCFPILAVISKKNFYRKV